MISECTQKPRNHLSSLIWDWTRLKGETKSPQDQWCTGFWVFTAVPDPKGGSNCGREVKMQFCVLYFIFLFLRNGGLLPQSHLVPTAIIYRRAGKLVILRCLVTGSCRTCVSVCVCVCGVVRQTKWACLVLHLSQTCLSSPARLRSSCN